MKIIVPICFGFIAFAPLAAVKAFAIVPPSTAVDEDSDEPSHRDIRCSKGSSRIRGRLEVVLRKS